MLCHVNGGLSSVLLVSLPDHGGTMYRALYFIAVGIALVIILLFLCFMVSWG